MSPRPLLRALAEHVGILSSYIDQGGRPRPTTDATRVALLAGMGIDAADEASARWALAAERSHRAMVLAPVRVTDRHGARGLATGAAWRDVRGWSAEVECEDGQRLSAEGRRARAAGGVRLPPLPLGYHRLRLRWSDSGGAERSAEQRLIVAPEHCHSVQERLGRRRVYGILANLYTLRSAANWGCGDLGDLARVIDWGGGVGAAFVGINPLHALHNQGEHISPYSPVSRLYRNPIYVDVTAVPEWSALAPGERAALAGERMLDPLRAAERIDYGAVRAAKEAAFVALHATFRRSGSDTARRRGLAAYVAAEGAPLRAFATYLALYDHCRGRGLDTLQRWPAPYRDPGSAAVREFAARHADAIERHCFVQYELDRQLGGLAERARRRSLEIGVYQDLAIGSSREGSDVWSFPGLFLDRVSIGAPPDDYSPTGQNWQLPPLDPRALAASGYDYWIRLIRAAMRHAGALRIDHIMGLFRQYWIPAGADGTGGAYVRFPSADLLGILALESERAAAVVIGEDLGTVPRGLPAVLSRWRILSTRVLYFERTARGGFRPARAYPRRALVGANTHDLAPLAGFWEGADIAVRRDLGLIADVTAAESARRRDRAALLRRLRADGLLPRRGGAPSELEVRAAVHAFLARTPAALAGAALDDCTGETTPVNLPGVPLTQYPSWSRRMRMPIERLAGDAGVARTIAALAASPRRARRGGAAPDRRLQRATR